MRQMEGTGMEGKEGETERERERERGKKKRKTSSGCFGWLL